MKEDEKRATVSDRYQERKEQLLDVATELFSKYGLDGINTKDIAKAAHVSPGLMYHYYDSKEVLLVSIIERFKEKLRSFEEYNVDYQNLELEDGCVKLCEAYYHDVKKNLDTIFLLMKAAAAFPAVRNLLLEFRDSEDTPLVKFLQMHIDKGNLCDIGALDIAHVARNVILMACMNNYGEGESDLSVPEIVHILLHGVINYGPKS